MHTTTRTFTFGSKSVAIVISRVIVVVGSRVAICLIATLVIVNE
jgi:hypothetical protein